MTFSTKTKVPLLFSAWSTGTIVGLVFAMVTAAAGAAFYEGLQQFRIGQNSLWEKRLLKKCPDAISLWKNRITSRLVQSLCHMVQVSTAYILMLYVMTFNIWIVAAILLGAVTGRCLARPFVKSHFFQKTEEHCSSVSASLVNGIGHSNEGEIQRETVTRESSV